MSSKKFLILGSNSFSGATFAAYLARNGHEVLVTSRSEESHEALLPYRWGEGSKLVRFTRIDLNHDLDSLDALMKAEKPNCVVNFAAQSMVGESWDNPDHWMMTNVVSTIRLHDHLRKHDFLDRYVHVTTPEVYGSTNGWVKEDAPFNPSTPYAVSRAASDMSLRTYFDQYKFPVVSTRAANVFGPGQQLYRIIPRTILFALSGRTLQLHGGGASVRSFIHMDDVSNATFKIAVDGNIGETYHISTDRLISIKDLVKMIFDRLGADFDKQVEIVGERPGKDTAYRLDSGKLRETLGWSDKIKLEDGISQTIEWAQKYQDQLVAMDPNYNHKP